MENFSTAICFSIVNDQKNSLSIKHGILQQYNKVVHSSYRTDQVAQSKRWLERGCTLPTSSHVFLVTNRTLDSLILPDS